MRVDCTYQSARCQVEYKFNFLQHYLNFSWGLCIYDGWTNQFGVKLDTNTNNLLQQEI